MEADEVIVFLRLAAMVGAQEAQRLRQRAIEAWETEAPPSVQAEQFVEMVARMELAYLEMLRSTLALGEARLAEAQED